MTNMKRRAFITVMDVVFVALAKAKTFIVKPVDAVSTYQ